MILDQIVLIIIFIQILLPIIIIFYQIPIKFMIISQSIILQIMFFLFLIITIILTIPFKILFKDSNIFHQVILIIFQLTGLPKIWFLLEIMLVLKSPLFDAHRYFPHLNIFEYHTNHLIQFVNLRQDSLWFICFLIPKILLLSFSKRILFFLTSRVIA